MKPFIAAALMIAPVLIAAAISYWPHGAAPPISSVLVLPAQAQNGADEASLIDAIPSTLSQHLAGIQSLEVKAPAADGADLLVLPVVTLDSGLMQLNLQVVDSRNHRVIWTNAYQAPRGQYFEMLHAAGEGLRRALKP